MWFIEMIFNIVLWLFSWIAWGVIVCVVFAIAMGIPFAIWEGFMYFTFNNLINAVAKVKSVFGIILGFLMSIPFAIPGVTLMLWCYSQICCMGLLVFHGDPTSKFARNFLTDIALAEGDCSRMVIARFFYNHCQWVWGGASIFRGVFPWQNGSWADLSPELPIPLVIAKLFIVSIPYALIFIIPLFPVLWTFLRPILGAAAKLPSSSGNGDGRD